MQEPVTIGRTAVGFEEELAKSLGPIVFTHALRDVAMPEMVDNDEFQSSLDAMEQYHEQDGPAISVQTPQIVYRCTQFSILKKLGV